MYHKLKSIPFFKDYKVWKNFTLWKHLQRRNMMRDRSQLLTQDLFMLDPYLNKPLIQIKKFCVEEIANLDLFRTSFEEPVTIKQFTEMQDQFRASKLVSLQEIEQMIKKTIQTSCTHSMQIFKEENRIQNRNDLNDGEEPPPLLVGDETNKEMPYTQEATIRTHQKKLRKFIKLIDYIFLEAKMNMIVNSIEKLYQIIKLHNEGYEESLTVDYRQRRSKAGSSILIIEAGFQGTNVTYSPSREQAKFLFEDTINKMIALICGKHKQFLHESEFAIYAKTNDFSDDPSDEIINMQVLIKNDETQKNLVQKIKKELDIAFNFVEQGAESVKPLLEIYQNNIHLDIETFRNKEIDEIRAAMNRFRDEDEKLYALENKTDIGLYCLDKNRLKMTIRDCASICLNKLQDLLPRVNYERAESLTNYVNELNDKLKSFPDKVADFVTFMRNLNETNNQMDRIVSKLNEIRDMSILIDDFHIKIRDEKYKAMPIEAKNQVIKLKEKVKTADESMNINMNKFRRELEKDIAQVGPMMQELSNKINDPILSDKNSNIDEVVAFLAKIGKEIEDLIQKGRDYNFYQEELQMEVTPFVALQDFKYEFKTIEKLWVNYKEWNDRIKKWKATQFEEISMEEIVETHEKLTKISVECVKKLELNEVAKIFKNSVDSFKSTVDLLGALKESALKEKHWEEIRELLSEIPNIPEALFTNRSDPALTLETIINLKLDSFTPKIQDIAVRAVKEEDLEKMLKGVDVFWRTANLNIILYKTDPLTNKPIYILGNNDDLISKLDDALVTITNIFSSRYVEGIRHKVEKEQKLLEFLREYLDAWTNCQKNWIYLESIFSSPDITKSLVLESKRFKNVHQSFMFLTKKAEEKRSSLLSLVKDEIIPDTKDVKDPKEGNYTNTFITNNTTLESIQKALEDYLENKRRDFPRFFFLSNDELLEIISQAKDPRKIQPHLRKCFEAINKLEFELRGEEVSGILAMISRKLSHLS